MSEPAPIACRLALRLAAHVLHGEAETVRGRTGRAARQVSDDDLVRRATRAARLDRHAARLLLLSRTGEASRWPSSEASLVGCLLAVLADCHDQRPDLLADMGEEGRTMPPRLDWNDLSEVARIALGVPDHGR